MAKGPKRLSPCKHEAIVNLQYYLYVPSMVLRVVLCGIPRATVVFTSPDTQTCVHDHI